MTKETDGRIVPELTKKFIPSDSPISNESGTVTIRTAKYSAASVSYKQIVNNVNFHLTECIFNECLKIKS